MESDKAPEKLTVTQALVIKFFEPKLNLQLFSKIIEYEIDVRIRKYVMHRNGDQLHDKEILISGTIDENISEVLTKEEQEEKYKEYLEKKNEAVNLEILYSGIEEMIADGDLPSYEREAHRKELEEDYVSEEELESYNNYWNNVAQYNTIHLYLLIGSKIFHSLENDIPFSKELVDETMAIYESKIYRQLPEEEFGVRERVSPDYVNYLFEYIYDMIMSYPTFLIQNFLKDIAKYNFQMKNLSNDQISIIFDYLQNLHQS